MENSPPNEDDQPSTSRWQAGVPKHTPYTHDEWIKMGFICRSIQV